MPSCIARRLSLVGFVLISVVTSAAAPGQDAAQEEPALPLKRVVLFSSSVGFFEHRGEVEGNRQLEFAFKTSEINDLLKSLVVQDRGGGLVTAVNYGSPEPVARTLRTFAIDLTASPSLAQIFQQLRGQRVKLETPASVSGVVVGVEKRKLAVGEKESLECELLNLRTEHGLQSFRIDSISRTELLDPKLDREFQQALDLLAQAHSSEQKRVKLDFRGEGKRNVSVGYIQEAPVWKTSYRLVLADNKAPFLQGWAIVENTTAQDWRDVQLTLVSGRPISFLMDLYEPLFMTRPFVTPQQHASLRPRVYEQDLAAQNQEFERMAQQPMGGRRGTRMGMGSGGAMMGGMGGGMGGGGFFGGEGGSRSQRPFATGLAPGGDDNGNMDLKQGVASAASGEDVGELFRYVITAPVTLGRNESSMLPIVNDEVKGEKVAIYNPAVHVKHPLSGLRLTNTTPLHLLQGPITVFDGGEYAGDARIEDIGPNSTRLISYALDLETEIAIEGKPVEETIASLRIEKGTLHVKHKYLRVNHYVIKNASSHAKDVVIERPIEADWRSVAPIPVEKTRSLERFSQKADPGKPARLTVNDEREANEELALGSLMPLPLQMYADQRVASAELKQSLKEIIAKRIVIEKFAAERTGWEQRVADLEHEQTLVRANLESVPAVASNDPFSAANKKLAGDLLQRYLTKLTKLENDLEAARSELVDARQVERGAIRELTDFLRDLMVE